MSDNRISFHDIPQAAWDRINWAKKLQVAAAIVVRRSRNIGRVRNIESVAASVVPEEAEKANRDAAALGLSDAVKWDKRGRCFFKDRPSKFKALKAMGMFDKDDGPSPRRATG
jgi:hypothetical protein